jgi:serine/threonine protein kinase
MNRRKEALPGLDTFAAFARDIDRIHEVGLVHWDLKPANICFDGDSFLLIDWEPSLVQRRDGRMTLVVTPAYITPSERGGARPTSRSDRFGWCKTLLRLGFTNRSVETFGVREDEWIENYIGEKASLEITRSVVGKSYCR